MSDALKNKIDFIAIAYVEGANPNGDPLNANRPRTTIDGLGEISDVCIKRKLRNRLQDEGQRIFVQSDDRADDGKKSLRERADPILKECKDRDRAISVVCAEWFDVRAFGQVFAFKGKSDKSGDGVSIGIRGPVSIRPAMSVMPVDIISTQITKSVNSETTKDKKSSDTMGTKYRVENAMYLIRGSINPQLASKTGFSEEDANIFKNALRTLFVNDASSARPDGSMDLVKLVWYKHNCAIGQYSSAIVHNAVKVKPKVENPRGIDDYEIMIDDLEGLSPEIY